MFQLQGIVFPAPSLEKFKKKLDETEPEGVDERRQNAEKEIEDVKDEKKSDPQDESYGDADNPRDGRGHAPGNPLGEKVEG